MPPGSLPPSPKPASRRVSAWGEGPFWHQGALWHVDIEGHALVCFEPGDGQERAWDLGQRVGFARPLDDGGLIWGGDRGLYRFDPASGRSFLLPGTEPESPDHRYNDAGISPDGYLFAGTISLRKQKGTAHLHRLAPNGSRSIAFAGVTTSNGIGWSPDGRLCYYIDTPRREVLCFDYDGGELRHPRVFLDTAPLVDASPDGLCLDAEGHLWIAFCHGGCVVRVHGGTAEPLARMDFPCIETTACCFGGAELDTLYVTTGIPPTAQEALAGRLFAVHGLGVKGLPCAPFRLEPARPS